MNRRDAIKKLSAGGAVALGASAVLSSNDVAFAASPPDTGLVGVPAQGAPLPLSSSVSRWGTLTIDATSNATCASAGSPTVIYAWKVNSYSFDGPSRLLVFSNGQLLHSGRGGSGYSATSPGYRAVTLVKVGLYDGRLIHPLSPSDSYSLSVLITWQCSGANSALEAEYVLNGTGSATPYAPNSSWNIV